MNPQILPKTNTTLANPTEIFTPVLACVGTGVPLAPPPTTDAVGLKITVACAVEVDFVITIGIEVVAFPAGIVVVVAFLPLAVVVVELPGTIINGG